jgi:hypothetical protein
VLSPAQLFLLPYRFGCPMQQCRPEELSGKKEEFRIVTK